MESYASRFRYALNSVLIPFKFNFSVKQPDGSKDEWEKWERQVTIPGVAEWAAEGSRTVEREFKFLVEVALREKHKYMNLSQTMAQNGSISCYVQAKSYSYELPWDLLEGSKGKLIQHYTTKKIQENMLDLCINFMYYPK